MMSPIEFQAPAQLPLTFIPPVPVASATVADSSTWTVSTLDASGDVAEFSDESLSVARADAVPRFARVRVLRDEIEAGIFETPQRIAGTVDRLMSVLGLSR